MITFSRRYAELIGEKEATIIAFFFHSVFLENPTAFAAFHRLTSLCVVKLEALREKETKPTELRPSLVITYKENQPRQAWRRWRQSEGAAEARPRGCEAGWSLRSRLFAGQFRLVSVLLFWFSQK